MKPSLCLKFIWSYFRKVELETTAEMTGAEARLQVRERVASRDRSRFHGRLSTLTFSIQFPLFKFNPTKMVLATLLMSRLNGIALN